MRIRERFGSKAALALVFAFLAGLFAGIAVSRFVPSGAEFGPVSERVTLSLEALDLTPAQQERVEAILASSQARTDRALAEVLPRIQAVVDSVDAELAEILTEEQRARLEEIRRHPVVRRRVIVGGPGADSLAP